MVRERHQARTAAVATAAVLFFLFAPLAVVVLFSFHSSPSLTLPFRGFSLRWYEKVVTDPDLGAALIRSLVVATSTAVVTLVLGTSAAYAISRARPTWLRTALTVLFFVPIAVPGLFLGLALVSFFLRVGVKPSLGTVLLAHCVYTFPFFLLIARMALDRLDPALEEAAADLGASRWQVFTRVVLPITWPVLAGAAALAFMLSFDEFLMTFFVAGQDQTLPLYLFGVLRRSIDPTINVISTLLLAITLAVTLAGTFMLMRGIRREERGQQA